MRTVFIGSTGSAVSGKTTLTLGLSKALAGRGLRTAVLRPLGRVPVMEETLTLDEDAVMLRESLGLAQPIETICPVVLTRDLEVRCLQEGPLDLAPSVEAAIAGLAPPPDVLLVSGAGDMTDGTGLGLSGRVLAARFGWPVLLVEAYRSPIALERIVAEKAILGDRLAGIVLNRVPEGAMPLLREHALGFLARRGLPVVGVLPHDRTLASVSVAQLAGIVGADVIVGKDLGNVLVEHFAIGAMDVESALASFRRVPGKAIFTGGHRVDIILAALETSTRCLVLTGGVVPPPFIIDKIERAGVPILGVRTNTFTAVDRLEQALGRVRLRGRERIERAAALVAERLDLDRLFALI